MSAGFRWLDATGKLVGIISEGDFIRRSEIGTQRKRGRFLKFILGSGKEATDFVHEHGRKVGEIMTPEPLTINEDTDLEEIVELMEKNNVKRLPVMRGDKLVGIVSRSNLLQAVASLARQIPDPTADDDHIRNRIIDALEKKDWCPFGLSVIVRDGIVHLSGVITEERSRQATIVAAENVAGVKKVHDHLCWVDTMSGMYLNSPEDEEPGKGELRWPILCRLRNSIELTSAWRLFQKRPPHFGRPHRTHACRVRIFRLTRHAFRRVRKRMEVCDRRDRPAVFPAVMLRIDASGAATFRGFSSKFAAT